MSKALRLLSVIAVFAHLSTFAPSATAHQKWLWPNVFVTPQAPVWISVDVTWGDRAFIASEGTGEQSVTFMGPDTRRETAASAFIGKTKTTAEMELTVPGTYRIEAVDPATYWTQVRVNGREQWKKAARNEVSAGEIIRADLYYAEAIAYVTVGDATPIAKHASSDPIEIQLTAHPSTLTAGKPIEFQVLSYGKPAKGATVKLFDETTDGHNPQSVAVCDEQGRGALRAKAPGRHLLSCELELPVKNDLKADMHAFNAYLTVQVSK
jgi:uncharacterized GH25 family protein